MTRISFVLIPAVVLLCTFFLLAGCSSRKDKAESSGKTKDAAAVPENPAKVPFWKRPFQRQAVAIVSKATETDKAVGLGISGFALLILCTAIKFLAGSWRPAFIVFGMGVMASACAALLADYTWVVLLIPLCGLAFLAKYVIEWWTGYQAWVAVSTEIENADTGEKSVGQKIKDRFAEAGLAPVLDKALKMMKKLWKKEDSI